MRHIATLSLFAFLFASVHVAQAQCDCPPVADRPIVTIAAGATGTTNWTCDNTYVIDGYVFVQDGQVLTIDAGTVVKGAAGSGADAAALIVSRGGQIIADGTADCPIIMTYEADPLDGSVSYDTRGQWGGLIVLGNATTNFGGVAQVEGIPADNDQASYGGDDDTDNSGVLRYVSVRHGGAELGAANEINGITFAAVGFGTTVENVEVVSNLDDGIEFFGGAVSVTNAIVAFCGDDSFDWDQGYHGDANAHWLAIQDQPAAVGDRGGELDGDDSDDGNVSADEMPFSTPTVAGWTIVGVGGNQGLLFRNGSGGHVSNAVITNVSEGIEIEDKETPEDAFDRWVAGDLTLMDITVVGDAAIDYDGSEVEDGDDQLAAYAAANNIIVDNGFAVDYTFAFNASGTTATDTLNVECGAGSGHDWALGWTFCDAINLFGGQGTINNVETAAVAAVTLWPNPTCGDLRVAGLEAGATLEVRTMTGALVWEGEVLVGEATIPTQGWTAGAYIVVWNAEGVTGRERFIVR
ncbi:MAG: T9SS type A sorting domain-containing protein [Flavobacteriales bacterium]